MKITLLGHRGKVGRVLAPALTDAGHELVDLDDAEAMVDFTAPDAVEANVRAAVERGLACVIGTSGFDLARVDALARAGGVVCFHAPNFALGAVLMMRFAREAAAHFPRAEIIELHNEGKKDAPSGTARATAEDLPDEPAIHSVRLPGLVAHQEVLFGGDGQLLTIRHDTFSREAFVPGVLLALERLPTLPGGLTVGLEKLL
jgi:4-hydroxy-tetrahydrodipicolinate reductase